MKLSSGTLLLPLCAAISAIGQTMMPVATRSVDNARTGWNTRETSLTQKSITANGVRLAATVPLGVNSFGVGDARGMEAQPLIAPQIQTANGIRDVMILPAMSGLVRAVDAHDGSQIWETTVGFPVQGSRMIDMHEINDHWGCLSTGVIVAPNIYLSCWVSPDRSGTPQSARYRMFILNLATGRQVVNSVDLQGTDTGMWKQRSSLVYLPSKGQKGTILLAHGSVYETTTGWTGGITAFDVATNKIAAQLRMPEGIWMGGQGLSCDTNDTCFAITANGDLDPEKGWYGEAFIKIVFTPATAHSSANVAIADQWSPWSDFQRSGQQKVPAGKLAGDSMPSQEITPQPVGSGMSMPLADAKLEVSINDQGQPLVRVFPVTMAKGAWSDEDWGSAGPACLFALKVCIAAGKDGIGYPIRTDAPGRTTAQTVGTAANYRKLAAPCAWLTMSPGRNVPCDPDDPKNLNFFPNGVTAHLHMTPVQFYDPLLRSWTIFVGGENARIHKWSVGSTGTLTYIAESVEYASEGVRNNPPGGMPGSFCSGSSNGSDPDSAILVCLLPIGDANATVTNGRIVIYDPVHITADGHLKVLWDSFWWGGGDPTSQWYFKFNKFMPPLIDGGEIIIPTYDGRVFILK